MLIGFILTGHDRLSRGSMGAGGAVRLSEYQTLPFNVRKILDLCKSQSRAYMLRAKKEPEQ